MGKIKANKDYKNYSVSLIRNEVIETYPVLDIVVDDVEYEHGILPIADSKIFHDMNTGGMHYIFNLDLPSKVEAENLKLLRRSNAIKNMFSYDRNKKFDLVGFMPWIAVILLILFK